MSANLNAVSSNPKRILLVIANPGTSTTVGGSVGFWASELIHAWYEFTEHGYQVTIASPQGGKVEFDKDSNILVKQLPWKSFVRWEYKP